MSQNQNYLAVIKVVGVGGGGSNARVELVHRILAVQRGTLDGLVDRFVADPQRSESRAGMIGDEDTALAGTDGLIERVVQQAGQRWQTPADARDIS